MLSLNSEGYASDGEFRNSVFNYACTTERHNKRQKREGCGRMREWLLKVLIVPPKPNYFLALHEMGLNSNCFYISRFIIIIFPSIDALCHPPAGDCEFSLSLMAFFPRSRGLHGKFVKSISISILLSLDISVEMASDASLFLSLSLSLSSSLSVSV